MIFIDCLFTVDSFTVGPSGEGTYITYSNTITEDVAYVVNDITVGFECEVLYSKPAPIITWYLGDNLLSEEDIFNEIFGDGDLGVVDTVSELTLQVLQEYHGSILTCLATNPDSGVTAQAQIELYVIGKVKNY